MKARTRSFIFIFVYFQVNHGSIYFIHASESSYTDMGKLLNSLSNFRCAVSRTISRTVPHFLVQTQFVRMRGGIDKGYDKDFSDNDNIDENSDEDDWVSAGLWYLYLL